MDWLFGVDWEKAFVPQTALLEIFVRGTFTYIAIFALRRIVPRRQRGALSFPEVLLIVLVADAAQNAMAGDYVSITDGVLLVAVIVFWSSFLDWLGSHVPLVQSFVNPEPRFLIKDGEINWKNMKREAMTEAELRSELRLQGVLEISDVHAARIEGNGKLSVITNKQAEEN